MTDINIVNESGKLVQKNVETGETVSIEFEETVHDSVSVNQVYTESRAPDYIVHYNNDIAVLDGPNGEVTSGGSHTVLKSLANSITSGDTVIIKGNHVVHDQLSFSDLNEISISIRGRILLDDDEKRVGSVLHIENCSGVMLRGPGHLDMDYPGNTADGGGGSQSVLKIDNSEDIIIIGLNLLNGFNGNIIALNIENLLISNCVLDGSQERNVYLVKAEGVLVENCKLSGLDNTGSQPRSKVTNTKIKSDCSNITFDNCVMNEKNGYYLIAFELQSGYDISDITFRDVTARNVRRVMVVGNKTDEQLTQMRFEGGQYIGSDKYSDKDWAIVQDDTLESHRSIIIESAKIEKLPIELYVGVVKKCRIIGDQDKLIRPGTDSIWSECEIIMEGAGDVIVASNKSGFTVKDCIIDGSGVANDGLRESVGAENVEILNNTFKNMTGMGIRIQNDSGDGYRIIGNKINAGSDGIFLDSGCEGFIITNNDLRDSGGLTDNSGDVDKVIDNNLGVTDDDFFW